MPLILDDHLPQISTLRMSQNREIPHDIRIRNRRKRYLESHPEYFSPDLEAADPLLYDRLVRRFFTPADREIERRQKGYAGTLETDLLRSEAKLEEVQHPSSNADTTYTRTETGEIVAQQGDEEELSKEEAYERWYVVMEQRFLDGEDEDFDYSIVDESEDYDDRRAEERDAEEEWFDDEEPHSISAAGDAKLTLEGETGIQDF